MAYTDLNQIVQDYKISKEGGVEEFLSLQKRLSDVPVLLPPFDDWFDWSDLIIRADFYDPEIRVDLLQDALGDNEADEIIGNMLVPYPRIHIFGGSLSDHFYEDNQNRMGKVFQPNRRDSTARVIHSSHYHGCAVLFEREGRFNYIEILLTDTYNLFPD